jgi:hypothetical protein
MNKTYTSNQTECDYVLIKKKDSVCPYAWMNQNNVWTWLLCSLRTNSRDVSGRGVAVDFSLEPPVIFEPVTSSTECFSGFCNVIPWTFCFIFSVALYRNIKWGTSILSGWGGTYGHLLKKQISHRVHLSTTFYMLTEWVLWGRQKRVAFYNDMLVECIDIEQ